MPRENKFHLAWNERANTVTWITVGRMGGGCLAKASVSFWKRDKRELKQYEIGQSWQSVESWGIRVNLTAAKSPLAYSFL